MADIFGRIIKPTSEFIEDLARKLPEAFGKGHHRIGQHIHKAADEFDKAEDDLTTKAGHHPHNYGKGHHDPEDVAGTGTKAATSNVGKSLRPGDPDRAAVDGSDKVCRTDPVDVATGDMLMPATDVRLAGGLPLVLDRVHISSYRDGVFFGPSWASTLDQRLQLDADGVVFAADDGMLLEYPPPAANAETLPLRGPRRPLTWSGVPNEPMRIGDPATGRTLVFGEPRPAPGHQLGVVLRLTAVVDRNGRRIDITYTDNGLPGLISHHGGYRIAVDHHPDLPRVTALRLLDSGGPGADTVLVRYGYDHAGDLTEVANSSGLPLRLRYDDQHRITGWTDRNGTEYIYTYDDTGRVVRTAGSDGFLSGTFAYEGRTTTYTDSHGHSTVFEHNDAYRLIRETDPLGNITISQWDERNRLVTAITDPAGATTHYAYDEADNLTGVTRAGTPEIHFAYNDMDLPVEVLDSAGQVWRYAYDNRGNPVEVQAPDETAARFTYDDRGATLSETGRDGSVETFRPNPAGLPLEQTDARGNTITYTRDPFGRLRTVDAGGAVTALEWTVEGLLARRVDPDGVERSWTYDGEGNCIAENGADGSTTRYEYARFDIPSARVNPDGSRYEFCYDTELRLTQVRDPAGLSWDYVYDAIGRVVSETDFDRRTVRYAYDPAGRFASRINPLGQTVTHHYLDDGRLSTKDVDGSVTTFTYNREGGLLTAQAPDSVLEVERDGRGLTNAVTVDGRTMRFGHDRFGRRTHRVTPGGVTTTLTYDEAGNRSRLELAGRTLDFTHDSLGREVARALSAGNRSLVVSTAWDGASRLREQTLTAAGRPLRSRRYGYRADDRLASITDRLAGTRTTVERDAVGRPLRSGKGDRAERYTYDSTGRQTSASWPDDGPLPDARGPRTYQGTRLISAGSLHYTYDAAGRVVERRRKRLSRKPDIWRYTWDAENRLTSCVTPDGVRWTYGYDVLGRRTSKRRHTADGQVAEETLFSWDDNRLAEENDTGTGRTTTWEHDGTRPLAQVEQRNVPYGTQDSDPAADAQTAVDSRFFAIVTDLVGTPTELVEETGELAWELNATQWGITSSGGIKADTPLRFPGQYADAETGLHYNYFRHYDPVAGQYVTPDPLGLDAAPDPVGYVSDPSLDSDPLGLTPCLDSLQNMADQVANVLPERARQFQTVAVIHAETPKGPRLFVAGTSKSPLNAEQLKKAQELGLTPLPAGEYLPKPPVGERGGHAEQNILHFLHRRHVNNGSQGWLPTHGAASKFVCPDICTPLIGTVPGRVGKILDSKNRYKQFYWADRYTPPPKSP